MSSFHLILSGSLRALCILALLAGSGCSTCKWRRAEWSDFEGAWVGYGCPGVYNFFRLELNGREGGKCGSTYVPSGNCTLYDVKVITWKPGTWDAVLRCETADSKEAFTLAVEYLAGGRLRAKVADIHGHWSMDLMRESDLETHLAQAKACMTTNVTEERHNRRQIGSVTND